MMVARVVDNRLHWCIGGHLVGVKSYRVREVKKNGDGKKEQSGTR